MDNFGLSDRICDMDESDLFNLVYNNSETACETFSTDNTKMDLENYEMSPEWLELFDDPVLNDRMITEATNSPMVKTEHSYSIGKEASESDSAAALLQVKMEPVSSGITLDDNPGPAINPKCLELNTKSVQEKPRSIQTVTVTKQEPKVIFKNEPIVIEARRPAAQSLLKPSTVLLTKQNQTRSDLLTSLTLQRYDSSGSMFDSTDMDEGVYLNVMPMTPPGSGSDSESGLSPRESPTPSPIRQVVFKSAHGSREINPATAIYSQPIPTSGVLVLTEEEKRTLISEGYPIPSKLPLSKIEEKNLKKVRRKIKNKISAQESRRKRKEYMDHLEKKMEDISRENNDLRKKCDKYEQNNQSLISQLHKLQSMLKKLAPTPGAAQTGVCLMVLLLCFGVFLGDWIPYTLSGSSSSSSFNFGMSNPLYSSLYANTHSPPLQDTGHHLYSSSPPAGSASSSSSYPAVIVKPSSRSLLTVADEERACGAEPWPVILARKSYECIANLVTPSLDPSKPGTYSNTSKQPSLIMSVHYDSMIDA